ncbi:MAG: hypothetical protein FJ271_21865 [Planctomycetes bacterium]|nr:hypothetical protein [Planctomycetota bacterium]
MRCVAGTLVAVLMILVAWSAGVGAPVSGPRSLGSKNSLADGAFEIKESFRGGERACVIARGGSREDDLAIEVFDDRGRLVARVENSGDLVAAIWYPPRDAVYRIKIFSPENKSKSCYVSMK